MANISQLYPVQALPQGTEDGPVSARTGPGPLLADFGHSRVLDVLEVRCDDCRRSQYVLQLDCGHLKNAGPAHEDWQAGWMGSYTDCPTCSEWLRLDEDMVLAPVYENVYGDGHLCMVHNLTEDCACYRCGKRTFSPSHLRSCGDCRTIKAAQS